MGDIDVIRAVAGILSALGAIALYKFNLAQSNRIRAELLDKLDRAIAQDKKHSACELFRLLYGLRVDYEDVQVICSNNKVTKIILALQKTPDVVKHEDGQLKFTKLYEKRWVRRAKMIVMRSLAFALALLTVVMIMLMAIMESGAAAAMLVFVIPFGAFFAMQIKDIRHDAMVESLVATSET